MNPALAIPAFGPAVPEIILAAGALVLVLVGAYRGEGSTRLVNLLALGLLAAALVAVLALPAGRVTTFNGAFVVDPFAKFMKVLTLLGSGAAIVMSEDYLRREGIARFEFGILIVLSTVGMLVMISANDLIALYLGLELQSLSAYVIASFHRDNLRSTEAGLKYFVLGALSSGMLLYGASLVYGFTGTVSFEGIATALHGAAPGLGIILGIVFVAAGIAFKISAAPFHMWTPDVYQGAPTPVTAYMSAATKVAAFFALMRVLDVGLQPLTWDWTPIVYGLSVISVVVGAGLAAVQLDVKRMLAYSSVAHAGFILAGLTSPNATGIRSAMFYLIAYSIMTVGAFGVTMLVASRSAEPSTYDSYDGLGARTPGLAALMTVFLLSLAGIPPTVGFIAKLTVFGSAIAAGNWPLAVLGMLASVVAAYAYLRVVVRMYFRQPRGDIVDDRSLMPQLAGLVLAVSVVVLGVFPRLVSDIIEQASILRW
ncbi:MAG: NADH-quinone oxidoreductase subunit NuoN [Microvirga sp.]